MAAGVIFKKEYFIHILIPNQIASDMDMATHPVATSHILMVLSLEADTM